MMQLFVIFTGGQGILWS